MQNENYFLYLQKVIEINMSEFAMWAGGFVLLALFGIIGFLVNYSLTQLKGSFDMLLQRIDKISDTLETHNDKLISILTKHEVTSQWLDNHEKEIDEIRCRQGKLETRLERHKHKV